MQTQEAQGYLAKNNERARNLAQSAAARNRRQTTKGTLWAQMEAQAEMLDRNKPVSEAKLHGRLKQLKSKGNFHKAKAMMDKAMKNRLRHMGKATEQPIRTMRMH